MLKKLIGALVLALAGCAGSPTVLNQAQAVPVVLPAPPPSFPQPRYTPAGAGASPLGMPLQAPESQVERSPNKRVLPVDPTDPAPGLWAADEVRNSTTKYPTVADVELPLPASDDSNLEAPFCAHNINQLLKSEGQMRPLMELSFDDRRCVIARLYTYCWNKALTTATSTPRRGRIEGAMDEIQNFLAYACRNTRPGKRSPEKIWNAVTSVWDIANKGKKR
ncbi:hypothetical protein CYFUS_001023 [Cystobacter fuscus]|uniref:Lipoprotein n=1 Tax=Cystobacter fuscus TaxID=43 RepID=A0A250IV31_9BACT|nr:hypothetical protein [Cystobacter fuscus]ATB35609.1 hypothetical protein CYFUS_001023 [Cystobacter fuscus]